MPMLAKYSSYYNTRHCQIVGHTYIVTLGLITKYTVNTKKTCLFATLTGGLA